MNLLRDTSWDAILAFAEFAEDANFTRAAARLHLSQPALHTKISNLGKTLGVALYVRRGRRIDITETGRRVQRFARELTSTAEEFQTELKGGKSNQPVALAAGEGSYLYILGEGIRAYRAASKHPLRLETADRVAAVDAVTSARAHLGVASFESVPADLVVEPLTRVGQMIVMPTRYRLAARRSVQLKDLRGADLIIPPTGRPHRTMIAQMLQSAGVEWHATVEASGWELMIEFVRLGLGLAIVNACCRLPAGVVARPMPDLPSIQYYVFHLEKALPKAAQELKRFLHESANSWKTRN